MMKDDVNMQKTEAEKIAIGQTIAERLKVLLPHWNHHNDEHITQLNNWREKMIEEELNELAETIESAVFHMKCSGEFLSKALNSLNSEPENSVQTHHS
ncbi:MULTISPECIES: hypothetical protein [Shewanella]|jgi:hypothetical protein|uniref:DUF8180 domain-containing protein n=2 Tax=Shewanella psychromarinicola TaxID=2487742 RepID=A0ABM7BUS4_9GAMM|nr:hypothetical protein [Shewanella psychromarinicola]AZG33889.1 hypothetical protein EGC80_02410 [Shewanella psychromarinicola]MCL1080877.1 hypothetical protein [Shewanella psychromarinicola]